MTNNVGNDLKMSKNYLKSNKHQKVQNKNWLFRFTCS
jgi:hypothetical protein